MKRNSDYSEAALAESLKKDDREARRIFFEMYAPRVMTLCRRYASRQTEADDLLQNTFIKAFDNIRRFTWRGEGSLLAWLSRIAVNEALMSLRGEIAFETEEPIPDFSEPSGEEVQRLTAEQILGCMQQLPTGYKTVFNLHVFEQLPHAQIARMLGIKENSSASQFSRARKMLAKIIKERYGYPEE